MEEANLTDALGDTADPERVFAMLEKWTPRLLKLVGFKDAHRLALTDVILGLAKKVSETNERAKRGEAAALRTERLTQAIAKQAGLDVDALLREAA